MVETSSNSRFDSPWNRGIEANRSSITAWCFMATSAVPVRLSLRPLRRSSVRGAPAVCDA